MRVCIFEDRRVATLDPLALARPAFDLLCGMTSLRAKHLRAFGVTSAAVSIRPYLAPLYKLTHPSVPVNDADWLRAGPTLFVNARWLPDVSGRPSPVDAAGLIAQGPRAAVINGEVAYAVVPPERLGDTDPESLAETIHDLAGVLPTVEALGTLAEYPWHLVDQNADQIVADLAAAGPQPFAGRVPDGVHVVGPRDLLIVHPGAVVDPLVVADTTAGPVIIDRGAVVNAFTRLEGPCWVGRGSRVLGAKVRAGTSLGPNTRVGGEIECSVVLGNSNKYHDGFLGHSYLGEWVNLGAGTHTSDLRCDYGEVTLTVNGGRVNTGLRKVGAFIGDHTKSGLGTLLNTGTNAGVFCNLLPSGELLPKYVPSFCSVLHGRIADTSELSPLFGTACTVMRRRGEEFTQAHQALFRHLQEATAPLRRQALREADQRRLRASA